MSANTSRPSSTITARMMDGVGGFLISGVETMAQLSLGQAILKTADRVLWVVEKSAQWSLPVEESTAEENGKSFGKMELVRPLPWIFFLPSLVMLRAFRLGLNVGVFILGYPRIEAIDMVKFVQRGRRRLRAIKSNGVTRMRNRKVSKNKEEELVSAKKSLINSMLATLSALSCLESSPRTPSPPPTRIYVRNEPDATPTPEEQSTTESTSPEQTIGKRKHSQVIPADDTSELSEEEPDETFVKKLERMAAADSEDDQDYTPANEDLIADESSASSEDPDTSIDAMELVELRLDNLNVVPLHSTVERIAEEWEPTDDVSALHSTPVTLGVPEAQLSAQSVSIDKVRYYSPISSNDSLEGLTLPITPDVAVDASILEYKYNDRTTTPESGTTGDSDSRLDNGDLSKSRTSSNSGNSVAETTNGSVEEKRNFATGKAHQKGKRNSLAQRKKK